MNVLKLLVLCAVGTTCWITMPNSMMNRANFGAIQDSAAIVQSAREVAQDPSVSRDKIVDARGFADYMHCESDSSKATEDGAAALTPPLVNCSEQVVSFTLPQTDYDNVNKAQVAFDGYDTSTGCTLDSIDVYLGASESSSIKVENVSAGSGLTIYCLDACTCCSDGMGGTQACAGGRAGPALFRNSSDTTPMAFRWINRFASDVSPNSGVQHLTTYDGTTDFGGTSGVTFTTSGSLARSFIGTYTNSSDLAMFSHSTVSMYWQPQWINFVDTNPPPCSRWDGSNACANYSPGGIMSVTGAKVGGPVRFVYHGH
jgi:hypothetical protein